MTEIRLSQSPIVVKAKIITLSAGYWLLAVVIIFAMTLTLLKTKFILNVLPLVRCVSEESSKIMSNWYYVFLDIVLMIKTLKSFAIVYKKQEDVRVETFIFAQAMLWVRYPEKTIVVT